MTGKMAKMVCLFRDRLDFKEAKDCLEMMVFLGWLAYQASTASMVKMVCRSQGTLEHKVLQGNQVLLGFRGFQELMGKTERMAYLFRAYLEYPDLQGLMVPQELRALQGHLECPA